MNAAAVGEAISFDIVTQQHGGIIEVDSEPGLIAEFIVRLPRAAVERAV